MPTARLPQSPLAGTLLYRPDALGAPDVPDIAALLSSANAARKNPLNERQEQAFAASFEQRLTLLWGPPGTGKTATLGAIVQGWLSEAWSSGRNIIIGVGSSNWTAIDNVLGAIAGILNDCPKPPDAPPTWIARVRGSSGSPPSDDRVIDVCRDLDGDDFAAQLADPSGCFVVGGTWLQLVKLRRATQGYGPEDGWFDLLLVDEASQVKVAEAAGYFALCRNGANIVLAGDDRQLGPVYPLTMPDDGDGLLDCVFRYMRETHGITPVSLRDNYRTNREICQWPAARFYEHDYEAFVPDKRLKAAIPQERPETWPAALPWDAAWPRLLDPEWPVVVVTYPEQPYTLSNPFEARALAALTALYRIALGDDVPVAEFWNSRCGIVTPHRAQMANARGLLVESAGFPASPPPAVDTVDRFQGQERDLILAGYAVTDPDFVAGEEAFILDPRRFNVTLTRAREKFILFISDAVLNHLPSETALAREAAHLQLFVEEYCRPAGDMLLPAGDGEPPVPCRLHVCGGAA